MFSLSETARQMLLIFGIASSGYLLGRVHIKGISLGTSGIFLTGLLFGHFGAQLPESVQTLGLLLFITSVGLSAGPTFFRQLRTNGAAYCALCLSVAVIGALVCAGIILLADVDGPLAIGMMAGAFTTSPGLAAAREAVSGPGAAASVAAGDGIIYPVGGVCKVLFVQILPRVLHVDMDYERSQIQLPPAARTDSGRTLLKMDRLGLFPFALTVVLGTLLGGVSVPMPGGTALSLGVAGGPLIVGLLMGHLGRLGPVDLRPSPALYGPAKALGLLLLFGSAGADGGGNLAAIRCAYQEAPAPAAAQRPGVPDRQHDQHPGPGDAGGALRHRRCGLLLRRHLPHRPHHPGHHHADPGKPLTPPPRTRRPGRFSAIGAVRAPGPPESAGPGLPAAPGAAEKFSRARGLTFSAGRRMMRLD